MTATHGYQIPHFRGKDHWSLNVTFLCLDPLDHGCQKELLDTLKVAEHLFEYDDYQLSEVACGPSELVDRLFQVVHDVRELKL